MKKLVCFGSKKADLNRSAFRLYVFSFGNVHSGRYLLQLHQHLIGVGGEGQQIKAGLSHKTVLHQTF